MKWIAEEHCYEKSIKDVEQLLEEQDERILL